MKFQVWTLPATWPGWQLSKEKWGEERGGGGGVIGKHKEQEGMP